MFEKYTIPLFVLVAFAIIHVNTKPTEDAKKSLTLDTPIEILNSSNIRVPTRWEKGMELLGQIMDAIRFGMGRIVNFGMIARNEISNRAEEFTSEAANALLSLIAARDARKYIQKTNKNTIQQQKKRSTFQYSTPPAQFAEDNIFVANMGRENARLENATNQGILEAPLVNPLAGVLRSFMTYTPVVDRTNEKDKYGNVGGAGKFVVNGFEGFSNFLNSLLEIPDKAFQQLSKALNNALNPIGMRIIGTA